MVVTVVSTLQGLIIMCIFGCLVEPSGHPKTSYRGIWNQETVHRRYDRTLFSDSASVSKEMLFDDLEQTRKIFMYEKAVSIKKPSVVEENRIEDESLINMLREFPNSLHAI